MKSKGTAAVLAFFLGGFGGHKFYLGQSGMGVLYLLFFWTFIPAIVAFIEFIMLLVMSEEDFNKKYNAGMSFQTPQNIVVNVANTATAGGSDRIGKLKELQELRQAGVLTDVQFESEKQRVLSST
jgi:TM2 domain-containing membrane protein YozV